MPITFFIRSFEIASWFKIWDNTTFGYKSPLKPIGLKLHAHCAYGGELIKAGEESFEHFDPHSKGGKTAVDNFLYVCKEHNGQRGNMDFNEFLKSGIIAPAETILKNIANSLREFKGIKINDINYSEAMKAKVEQKTGRKLNING